MNQCSSTDLNGAVTRVLLLFDILSYVLFSKFVSFSACCLTIIEVQLMILFCSVSSVVLFDKLPKYVVGVEVRALCHVADVKHFTPYKVPFII